MRRSNAFLLYLYFIVLAILEFHAVRFSEVRLNLIFFVLISFFIIYILRREIVITNFISDSGVILFLLYLLWCTVTVRWSYIGLDSLGHIIPIWLVFLAAFLFSNASIFLIQIQWIKLGLFLVCICWLMLIISPSVAVLPDVIWRLNGVFAHAQRLALFSSSLLILLIVFHLNSIGCRKKQFLKNNFLVYIFAVFLFITLLATQARAFSFALIVTLYSIILFYKKGMSRLFVLVLGAILSLIVYYFIDDITQIFGRGDILDSSLTGRIPTWAFAIDLAIDRFYSGYGFGAFFSDLTIDPRREYISPHAHNTWINSWLETGVIGTVLLSLFMISVIVNGITYQRETKTLSGSLFLMLYIVLCGFTGVVLGGKVTTLMGLLLLVYVCERSHLRAFLYGMPQAALNRNILK